MGFCADAKDEVTNNRATFGTVGKFPDPQLTADLIPGVLGKKVQGGAEEEYQDRDCLPEVLKLLKQMSVFQRRVCWMSNARKLKTRHSMSGFGHLAHDRDSSVSSEVVEMSSHLASARFNHNTVINVCVLEELALCTSPSSI